MSASDPSGKSLGGGAIAGIAVLILIISGWFFWRRRNRAKSAAMGYDKKDGEKWMVGPGIEAPTAGTYQTHYQEMCGASPRQELEPTHSNKYPIPGSHELKAETQPSELPNHTTEDTLHRDYDNHDPIPEIAQTTSSVVSPHVEAQRRREMEWLEMEETRIRQRQEQLSKQGGAKTQ